MVVLLVISDVLSTFQRSVALYSRTDGRASGRELTYWTGLH